MVSDETYEICLPILQDPELDDEDKTDKLEELLKDKTTLTGSSLENAVLDALWRFKEGGPNATASPPPIRQTILRRPSPASWRGSATPISGSPRLGVSPLAPPSFVPSSFSRNMSSTVSPFSSPRPSPRLAFSTPTFPHSPSLNAYEFASDRTPAPEIYGEHQAENVDWLVSDDAISLSSSIGGTSSLNAAAPEFSLSSQQQVQMSPHDMLRSILGHTKTDEEIEVSLASHNYDLTATIAAIMECQPQGVVDGSAEVDDAKNILVGKSMAPAPRPTTPAGLNKSSVICKFFLSNGQCLRADCRFSHDTTTIICKYWMMGSCLAGDTCVFSHDPSHMINKLEGTHASPAQKPHGISQDSNSFPSLQGTPEQVPSLGGIPGVPSIGFTPPPGLKPFRPSNDGGHRPRSRPSSRHQSKEISTAPALDDTEAFPTLGSAAAKPSKKHHGKRGGHGHGHKDNLQPGSLADIVKRSPSPGPSSRSEPRKGARNGVMAIKNGDNSAVAQAIPSPKHIPWLETGDKANKAYLKARQEAIKHGGLRNKFLQSAAQAWNRNDARAAKALSLRGQSENELMRKAHREAAQQLYEERNGNSFQSPEIFVDLHGLHGDEAVEYLENILLENSAESRPIYAITGTGHHSKNGKDKVGKMIRGYLNDWKYSFREFSVPGDRNNMGGIIGIDARSWDRSLARDGGVRLPKGTDDDKDGRNDEDILSQGIEIGEGKVKLLVRDPPKGPSGRPR